MAAHPASTHFSWRRLLCWAGGAALLAAIFIAYLQPAFVVDLANRIYLCF